MEGFNIRFAEEKDTAVILELIRGIAEYEKLSDQVEATEELLKEWIFDKQGAEALLVETEGQTVGFALFFHNFSTFTGRCGLYLEDLFVKPEFRGRGYGIALLRKLAQIAVERKYGRFEWVCLDWNAPSIRLYRSIGAVPMDEWTIYRLSGDALKNFADGKPADSGPAEK